MNHLDERQEDRCEMSRVKIVLAVILVPILAFSALAYLSMTETFLFSQALTVKELDYGSIDYYWPTFQFNITDSNNYLGLFYFRMQYILPNQSSNTVYIDFQHSGNTKLDSIVFHFSSPEVRRVYLDMSDPVGVSYSSSRDTNSFTVKADFGELGTLQGGNTYEFILYDAAYKPNTLFFTADISMHYMVPLELTSLKAHVSINTVIPSA
jgi:hypothetical protein